MVKAARPSGSVLTNACKSGALSLPSAMDQDGRATARASPPAAVAPTFRSALRETLASSGPDTGRVSVSVVCRIVTPSLARVFYGSSNAIVGAASAYIAGHRVVYLRVRRAWIARQQRSCCHDLARLTISALNDVMIEPSPLHLPANRSLADGFNSSHCGLPDTVDRGDARSRRRAIYVNRTSAAKRHTASKLSSCHLENVPQHP